jgi:NAD(P)-dependent dehydrogenase (short-subunit alcohol dehydrogenase family)
MDQLAGRTAFITGGGQGIGLGIARALAREGVSLALADVNAAALESAHAELSSVAKTEIFTLDVRDRERFAAVADDAERRLGPVSLLFNNAGIAGGVAPAQMTYEMWDWVMDINVRGVINGVQTFVPRMIERGGDAYMVNTASGAGLVDHGAGFMYTTSKFAVVGLSESLRRDLASHGIGVSALCPGPVATDIIANTVAHSPTMRGVDPASSDRVSHSSNLLAGGKSPNLVGDLVVAAIKADQMWIHTDRMVAKALQRRHEALLDALPDVDAEPT